MKQTWFGCDDVNVCKHLAKWNLASGILEPNKSVGALFANANRENAGV